MVHDWASSVDTAGKKLMLANGASLSYDKLVLSPGIDIKYDSVDGYSAEAHKTPCRMHGSPAPRSSC
jgi:sulfide dehydrogenase [flavocytochrome c] flavoprotein subunit